MSATEGKIVLGPGEGKTIQCRGTALPTSCEAKTLAVLFHCWKWICSEMAPRNTYTKPRMKPSMVLEGEINVLMGKDVIKATAGSFVFVPKGIVHAMCRRGQKPAKFLATYSPPGFEKFFDDAAGLDVTDTEAYVAKAQALAKKYNMEVVGPPLKP